ncbi:DNA polymerase theta-like [Paramacrobiotus metropolitanus]|uniref:DNA polymerase theta-like n=1 Tax=Paramacrobiotus metropolitanus TaxID=2943436 RepID=UPI0024461CFC|nr:DNA polymerase theta-like [Paramacrobiotus metropolitanus]
MRAAKPSVKAKSADIIQQPQHAQPLHRIGGNLRPVGRGVPRKRSNPSPQRPHHFKPVIDVPPAPQPPSVPSTSKAPPQAEIELRSQETLFPEDSCFQELPSGFLRGEPSGSGGAPPGGDTKPSQDGAPLEIANWGLPEQVVAAYQRAGITTMFPWQAACLSIGAGRVLNGGNLVFSAPTSAGKTLVAEILLLKRVVESGKKGLFVLPFVALAQEKLATLRRLLNDSDVRVGGFIGNTSPPGGLALLDVAICTIERANSLVNRLMKEGKLRQIGVVVVDELHMVGDYSRGYLLELLLTKVIYLNRLNAQEESRGIQIIGMSATLPNLPLVKKWLDADLYSTDFRPVPLTETIKMGAALYDRHWRKLRDLPPCRDTPDSDHLCTLCLETIGTGHSVLIFCPAKNWCETISANLACQLVKALPPGTLQTDRLQEILEQLRQTPAGLDAMLKKTIRAAVAFHHAGLTADEREVVEAGFRRGVIKVLVATTTLSSGVNLPARRVIIRSPLVFDGAAKPMDPLTYYQMAGRAGRKGVDTEGESILICKDSPEEKRAVNSIFSGASRPLRSCLSIGSCEEPSMSVQRAVLEIVVNRAAHSVEHILTYLQGALFACELDSEEECKKYAAGVIKALEKAHFIQTAPDGSGVQATQLGNAIVWSGLSPHDGKAVFDELAAARCNFNLQNELHILYLITPLNVARTIGDINFYLFLYIWDKMPAEWQRVGHLVGVDEVSLAKGLRNELKDIARLNRIKRFWCALMLNELVHEASLWDVARRFEVNKGVLQSLQHGAASYSGMITVFCEELRWANMTLLFEQFQSRLMFGVMRELVPLVRIPYLTALQARSLYEAGFPSLTKLATAGGKEVAEVLRAAVPFEIAEEHKNSHKKSVLLNGLEALSDVEAAELIIGEARRLVEADLEADGLVIIAKQPKDHPAIPATVTQRATTAAAEYDEIRSTQMEADQPLDEVIQDTKRRLTQKLSPSKRSPAVSPSKSRWIPPDVLKQETAEILQRISDPNLAISSCSSSETEEIPAIDDLYTTPRVQSKYDPEFQQFRDNLSSALKRAQRTAEKTAVKDAPECGLTPHLFSTPRTKRPLEDEEETATKRKLFREEVKSRIQFDIAEMDDDADVIPSSCPPSPEPLIASDILEDCDFVIPAGDVREPFEIEDVPNTVEGFQGFLEEWKQQTVFSLSLGCEKLDEGRKPRIGPPGLMQTTVVREPAGVVVSSDGMMVVGLAVSWSGKRARYVSLVDRERSQSALEVTAVEMPAWQRVERVKEVLGGLQRGVVILYDSRAQLKVLGQAFGAGWTGVTCLDPQVGDWMLDMGAGERSLKDLMSEHLPLVGDVLNELTKFKRPTSLGLAIHTRASARTRSTCEAVAARLLLGEIRKKLELRGLWEEFVRVEMGMVRCLLALELNGFGVSVEECQRLLRVVSQLLEEIQQRAIQLVGPEFVITSPQSVGQALFETLRLVPPEGRGRNGGCGDG